MLGGNEDIVDSYRLQVALVVLILDNDLRFAVRSEPRDLSRVSSFSHFLTEKVSKVVRVGMKGLLIPFICGISEHKTLISSSEIVHILFDMDSICDFWALTLNIDQDTH